MIVIRSFISITAQILKEYAILAILFAVIMICIRHRMGRKNNVGVFFLYMYSVLIYGATVFERITKERVITDDFLGIRQWFENPWYLVSFAENIAMFIPFGIFYVLAFENIQSIRECLKWTVTVSLSIECMQGLFHLGEAQILDIFANVIGALIGWTIINKCKMRMR